MWSKRAHGSTPDTTKSSVPTAAVGKRTLTEGLYIGDTSGSANVQQKQTQVGTHKTTDFGDYWVIPDGTKPPKARVGEVITQTQFAALEVVWNKVKDGSGSLIIEELDEHYKSHADFKALTISRIGLLLSKPKGRQLIIGIVTGPRKCAILPKAGKVKGGGFTSLAAGWSPKGVITNGKRGGGDDAFIIIDANANDNDIKVQDANGNDIADPIYIILGHELIHARHAAVGKIDMGRANNKAYRNKEEENTVATGDLTENDLRTEHGLKKRVGSGAKDLRP